LCHSQIKYRAHKLISLGTAVENIHSNIKKSLQNFTFYRPYYDVIKIKPIFYESTVQVFIFSLSLE